jgi:creatinine amidohydrolase
MPAPNVLRLAAMDRRHVARLSPEAVLILPVGAVEQHGPSLPLGTDAALAEAVAVASMEAAGTSRPLVLAPTVPYGNSIHHLFACAGSLSSHTLLLVLADLIDSFVRSGFHRVFLLNGHGGNDECVRLAVKDAVNRHPVLLGAASYWTLAPTGELPAAQLPGHAGTFEASLLMAARSDLLPPEAKPSGEPGPPATHTRDFGPGVTVVRAGDWAASGGFTDDPANADAETGRRYLAAIARQLAAALDRFADVPLPAKHPGESR